MTCGMPNEHTLHGCCSGPAAGSEEGQPDPSLTAKPSPEPRYQMEALDEIFQTAKPGHQAAGQQGPAADAASSSDPDVPLAHNANDTWGTTRQSPAEIARRIAESNAGEAQNMAVRCHG